MSEGNISEVAPALVMSEGNISEVVPALVISANW